MTSTRRRVVMIVLDAVEPLLLDEGMESGWLPNLARFFAAGTSLRLAPIDQYLPGAAWPSLNTGIAVYRTPRSARPAPRALARTGSST